MSIFDQYSTPVEGSPEMDTDLETAEESENIEETYEEETVEEEQEDVQEDEEEETDPEEGHSEKLLAGKYKSPEDLETAYLELQRSFTKQRMAEKTQQQQQQQPIQQHPSDIDFNDPQAIIDAINQDPMGTIAKIAQQTFQQARSIETQEQAFKRGIEEVSDTYKDYLKSDEDIDSYFVKVGEICRDLGVNAKTPSPRVLKMAANELWGDPQKETISKVYQQAKAAGKAEAEQARKAKAGLGAPTNTKPKEKPKTAEELIADSIVAAGSRKGIFG